jgi:2,3-bisphosphoglycerate-dependent phosphoglycerate mutase
MSQLILLRHGQSVWNKKGLYTGWVDVPLSKQGIDEAMNAGALLSEISIHEVHVSNLIRAQMTAMLALAEHSGTASPRLLTQTASEEQKGWSDVHDEDQPLLPVYVSWKLNERMYGELQGKNKQASIQEFGEEQVRIWRRSYDVPPPGGESLKMTAERTLPYFESMILPTLQEGKNVLIVAHGNSLRSIVMSIEQLTPEQILQIEIPTGQPLIYDVDKQATTFVRTTTL